LKPEAFISDLDGLEFKINDLLGWVKQADACVRAYSGIFSLFAPKVSAIEVVFSAVDGASVVVSSIKGTKVLPADSGGIVTIDTESEDYSSDTTFHLSTTPLELRPKIPDSIEFHSKTDS
jgi:hypothetical protein